MAHSIVHPPQIALGQPVPPNVPHAISVSLPTYKDNVDYEEAAPRVVSAMVSGYPRFFVSLKVKELVAVIHKQHGQDTEAAFIWPSLAVAQRCSAFFDRHYTSGSSAVRIVEFEVEAPLAERKPDLTSVKVYATFFPKDAFGIGKQFWQHAGDIVSSRLAAHCLRWIAAKAEQDQAAKAAAAVAAVAATPAPAVRMPRAHRHYSSNNTATKSPSPPPVTPIAPAVVLSTKGTNGTTAKVANNEDEDDEDRPVEDETDGMSSQDYELYVEERYGRNLDLSFAPKAKLAMRRRIASQVAHHASSGSEWSTTHAATATSTESYVTEEDVYLYPTGMSAIFNSHRLALALSPLRKSICFGFPYTDTLKILQKFGPGCYFYGHGEDKDIELLEQEVLARTAETGCAEEDKILAVVCEFPSNPLLKSANLIRLNQLADQYGFLIIVDETLGNFVNVRTLEYADIVVSSLSKIFSGDSNVMGGSLVLNPHRKFYKALKQELGRQYEDLMWMEDAIFMERNSRTFQARIQKIDENSEQLCDFLKAHPKVKDVYYPKYVTPANYLAHKVEGAGYGGLFSIIFNEGEPASIKFFDNLPFCKGPSLGTNFTLCSPYTILAHYEELPWAAQWGVPKDLIRVAVGLESLEVLMHGFGLALDAI